MPYAMIDPFSINETEGCWAFKCLPLKQTLHAKIFDFNYYLFNSNKFVLRPPLQSADKKPRRPVIRNVTATNFLIYTPLAG